MIRATVGLKRVTAWCCRCGVSRRLVFAIAYLALIIPSVADGQPIPIGPEFQVNTYTTLRQVAPSVAVGPGGEFVVVWLSGDSTAEGQRFDADGMPIGTEFQINTAPGSFLSRPSVAAGPAGNFVVVWLSADSKARGQRFDADGMPIGTEFQINTDAGSYLSYPSVAAGPAGNFVVVWGSSDSSGTDNSNGSIQGQRFASDGMPVGTEFQVNTYTTDYQSNQSVAVGPAGEFVVVWDSYGSSGTDDSDTSVQGQRFGADGMAIGTEFQVNTYTTDDQEYATVAVGPGGEFVVVWSSRGSSGTDDGSRSIQAQRFGADGVPVGTEFQVNTYTTYFQFAPSVATGPAGEFVVVWESYGSSGTDDIVSVQGQQFDADGILAGTEFHVNTYTTLGQFDPSVAVGSSGDFVVVWTSEGSSGTDNSDSSIQSQRFGSAGPSSTTTTTALPPPTTTTLEPSPACAQPVSTGTTPTASDCLFILKAAVGGVVCAPACICAPKGSLPATATDALICLKKAVGQAATLACPCL